MGREKVLKMLFSRSRKVKDFGMSRGNRKREKSGNFKISLEMVWLRQSSEKYRFTKIYYMAN